MGLQQQNWEQGQMKPYQQAAVQLHGPHAETFQGTQAGGDSGNTTAVCHDYWSAANGQQQWLVITPLGGGDPTHLMRHKRNQLGGDGPGY